MDSAQCLCRQIDLRFRHPHANTRPMSTHNVDGKDPILTDILNPKPKNR
jgi:hypothetical protein